MSCSSMDEFDCDPVYMAPMESPKKSKSKSTPKSAPKSKATVKESVVPKVAKPVVAKSETPKRQGAKDPLKNFVKNLRSFKPDPSIYESEEDVPSAFWKCIRNIQRLLSGDETEPPQIVTKKSLEKGTIIIIHEGNATYVQNGPAKDKLKKALDNV